MADGVARSVITVGGTGTIVAVCGVMVFLLWVVKDLFRGAELGAARRLDAGSTAAPLLVGCDEYQRIGWALHADGVLAAVDLARGGAIETHELASAAGGPTAASLGLDGATVVLGYADGAVRTGRIGFATSFHDPGDLPSELRALPVGESAPWSGGIVERTPSAQYRLQRWSSEFGEPRDFGVGSVVAVAHVERGDGSLVAALGAEGRVAWQASTRRFDPLSGEVRERWRRPAELPLGLPRSDPPASVVLADGGASLSLLWRDGTLARYSLRDPQAPALVETVDALGGDGGEVTAVALLLGGSTILVGDSAGVVRAWFTRSDDSLVLGHRLEFGRGAIRTLRSAARQRIVVAGSDEGADAFFATSEKHLGSVAIDGPVLAAAIAPKDDGLLAAGPTGLWRWAFDPRHPEVSLRSLFGRVWYERYDEPTYAWQSSSGTDSFEPKLSLTPLVFGTLKATLYTMLLAVPLALLAAIYTSEFLHRRTRARIKPLIELMASLPSVVLGFLAALVIAPAVERVVPAVLACVVTVPLSVFAGAHLWQLLPAFRKMAWARCRTFVQAAAIALGVGVAVALGPVVENAVFGGDVRLWLSGAIAEPAWPGWLPIALPAAAIVVTRSVHTRVNPWLRRTTVGLGRDVVARRHLAKFAIATVAFAVLALLIAAACAGVWRLFGADLRDGLHVGGFDLSPLGTYDQRNAMIVGFVMGFAVIPIVYTIAEDALASVPEHLRAASLGAGATPWQTAVRVVVPTAASGLFSAVMVGLGRAVGETMIVLMAAGNTPVTSLNAFQGFRTLSANIATELPEAVRDSTHYRTLFLAALVLFAMTFLINTLAEFVRQRFRRRVGRL